MTDKQERWSQYFTPDATANTCWDWLRTRPEIMDFVNPFFIEPSAGRGVFYNLMPGDSRMGFEIDPELARPLRVSAVDFLKVEEIAGEQPMVFVGNPPFGFRGKEALAFINKSFELGAKYVAFILPPMFKPDADGEPPLVEKRIKGGYSIAHLPVPTAFDMPVGYSGKDISGCAFVLYKRGSRPPKKTKATCNSYIKLRNISTHQLFDQEKARIANLFIPRALREGVVKREGFRVLESLPIRYVEHIAVFIQREEHKLRKLLLGFDWLSVAKQSSNGSYTIRQADVEQVVVDAGFVDTSPIELHTIMRVKGEERGLKHLPHCDLFIPISWYRGQEVKPTTTRQHTQVFGIKVLQQKRRVIELLKQIDWHSVAIETTNGRMNLNKARIRNAVSHVLKPRPSIYE